MDVNPSVKITNWLRYVSEQDNLSRAARSQKKWEMVLSAQKESQTRRMGVQKSTSTRNDTESSHHHDTHTLTHDDGIIQRVTGGHIPVIGH